MTSPTTTRPVQLALAVALIAGMLLVVPVPAAPAVGPALPTFAATAQVPATNTVGLVDIATGRWHLLDPSGNPFSFLFGNPGDLPIAGDWDGDGIDTPGLYRQSDGFFYLRNTNNTGIANAACFAGDPEDIPLVGDWNKDGIDTLGIYRPSIQKFFLFNKTCQNAPMGAADIEFFFGNPGDKPVSGDWDGDGITEVGLHRESTGFFYWRNTLNTGIASGEIFFGDPNDRFVAGDWGIVDEVDTPAIFRPSDATFYFRHSLTQGVADSTKKFGEAPWLPVSGSFGLSNRTVTVSMSGGDEQLRSLVESFLLNLEKQPGIPTEMAAFLGKASQQSGTFNLSAQATVATIKGQQVAVVTTSLNDVILASFSGGTWSIIGAKAAIAGKGAWYGGTTRSVMVLGSDTDGDPVDPTKANGDAPHIVTVRPGDGKGSILNIPRATLITTSYGIDAVHHSMNDDAANGAPGKDATGWWGPAHTTQWVSQTLGLPIEGYINVNFEGFESLIDAWLVGPLLDAYTAYLPWGSNHTGDNDCPRPSGQGCVGPGITNLTGELAELWSRERTPQVSQNPQYFGLPSGGIDRVEGHGYLIRAAAAKVKARSIHDLPALLNLMLGFVNTNLSGGALLTLGASAWELPPLDLSQDLTRKQDPALPTAVLRGCPAEGRSDYSPYTLSTPNLFETLWVNKRTFFSETSTLLVDFADGYYDRALTHPNEKTIQPSCAQYLPPPQGPGWPVCINPNNPEPGNPACQ